MSKPFKKKKVRTNLKYIVALKLKIKDKKQKKRPGFEAN